MSRMTSTLESSLDFSGFARDLGMSESFMIEELNKIEAENPNIGEIMNEVLAMLKQ